MGIKEARETMRQLREDFREKENQYYQREREIRAQVKEEQQARYLAEKAERQARWERRKKYEEENAPEPFDKEIRACEQLIGYLNKYIVQEQEVATTSKAEPAAEIAFGGMKKMGV